MITEIIIVVFFLCLLYLVFSFFKREKKYNSDPSPRYMEVDGREFVDKENQENPTKQETVYETARTLPPNKPNKLNFTL